MQLVLITFKFLEFFLIFFFWETKKDFIDILFKLWVSCLYKNCQINAFDIWWCYFPFPHSDFMTSKLVTFLITFVGDKTNKKPYVKKSNVINLWLFFSSLINYLSQQQGILRVKYKKKVLGKNYCSKCRIKSMQIMQVKKWKRMRKIFLNIFLKLWRISKISIIIEKIIEKQEKIQQHLTEVLLLPKSFSAPWFSHP